MNNSRSNDKSYGKNCSYILQENHLYELFDVQETMEFAANLKIGGISKEKRRKIVSFSLFNLMFNYFYYYIFPDRCRVK